MQVGYVGKYCGLFAFCVACSIICIYINCCNILCHDIIQSGPVVETLAYNLLLEAAMRAQHFHSRNLRLHGPWKWLLTAFADYYGVSDSYTKLRYFQQIYSIKPNTSFYILPFLPSLAIPSLSKFFADIFHMS